MKQQLHCYARNRSAGVHFELMDGSRRRSMGAGFGGDANQTSGALLFYLRLSSACRRTFYVS